MISLFKFYSRQTKYMNGHSDVIMGAAMTNNDEIHTRLRFLQNGSLNQYRAYETKLIRHLI